MTKYPDWSAFGGTSTTSQANALNHANGYGNAMQNSGTQALMAGLQNVYQQQISKLEFARQRHGKPFAADKGSTWVPRTKPVLTEWMEARGKK